MKAITELISRPGHPLIAEPVDLSIKLPIADHQRRQLLAMLALKNGFYAFHSSLHVFPIGRHPGYIDLLSWNAPELWKEFYTFIKNNFFCFAESMIGEQYCVYDSGIGRFDPETGRIEYMAKDIEGWAKFLMENNREAGYSWAAQWQDLHEFLPPIGYRLMMNKPAICGGEFDAGNMRCVNALDAMRFWGAFATATHDIPDGARIKSDLAGPPPDGIMITAGAIPQ